MQIDKRKWSTEQIEKNNGKLGAQIIVNHLIKNRWKMWFISNVEGNSLYSVSLTSGEKVIVGFTEEAIASNYINKKVVAKSLSRSFGSKIVLVQFTLARIGTIMKNNMEIATFKKDNTTVNNLIPSPYSTIIVNPTGVDNFVPINIDVVMSKLINDGDIDVDQFNEDDDEHDYNIYSLNKKEKKYFLEDSEEDDIV